MRWMVVAGLSIVSCALTPPTSESEAPTTAVEASAAASSSGPGWLPDVGTDALEATRTSSTEPVAPTTPLPDVSARRAEDGGRPGPERGWSKAELARIAAVRAIVRSAAEEFDVDANLINALIWVESKFQRKARGPAGAQGYMQIMPRTAKGLAKHMGERARPYDAKWNIRAGTFAISRLLQRFDGNESLAIAGYNRGAGTVRQWQEAGVALPERTQAYVARVMRAREWFILADQGAR